MRRWQRTVWWGAAAGLVLGMARLSTCAAPEPSPPPPRPPSAVAAASNRPFSPRRLPVTAALLTRLRVPPGFRVAIFARVPGARMLAVGPDGTVYVSQPDAGQVSALPAGGGTARAVVTGLSRVHGLAVAGGQLYLATPTRVYVATLRADGGVAAPRVIADGLPAGGQHPYRTLGVGPVGRLYVSVGSTCNACVERDHASAAIVQLGLDGGGRRVFARGLRNTEAFAWHPATGAMWGMDQGADNRGANAPPEELNRLVDGGSYGWPWCYGNRQVDPVTPGNPAGTTKAAFCAGTVPMTLGYQAHSSPLQLLFYTGRQFPATYRNDAFLTLRGSWNRTPAMGYKVVRLRFNAGGEPTGFVDFLTGFLTDNGQAQFGRPCGLAQARDGSLLVGDDDGGVIYRVRYE